MRSLELLSSAGLLVPAKVVWCMGRMLGRHLCLSTTSNSHSLVTGCLIL